MSAIDFYCSVDKVQAADGKTRVVVTFDGKYLPYTEQVCYFFKVSSYALFDYYDNMTINLTSEFQCILLNEEAVTNLTNNRPTFIPWFIILRLI
jgi:hypothetical protein